MIVEHRDAITAGIEVHLDTFFDTLIDGATSARIGLGEVTEVLRDDYSEDLGCWYEDRLRERGLL